MLSYRTPGLVAIIGALAFLLISAQSPVAAFQESTPEAAAQDDAKPDEIRPRQDESDNRSAQESISLEDDGRICFKFVDAPWSDVIQFFAEQANFSLQPIESEPEGTFKYHDDQSYTVMEALDQLNYALGLRGYTLVRNKRMLVLVSTERNIPDDLIETVTPEELEERGKHEILNCVFDLEGLEETEIDNQVEGLISRQYSDAFHVVPSAKQMIVREKGQTLRTINAFLEAARTRMGEGRFVIGKHDLKHIDPESMLEAARVLMDLNENNQSADGQFKVMVQPLSTELIFRGSANRVKQFKDLLAGLDIPMSSTAATTSERPTLRQYSVSGDLEMAFKVIQTIMANRDVKFDIDRSTAKAILLGREADHLLLQATLDELSSGGDDFDVIELKHMTTLKAMSILDQLYQRDKLADENAPVTGPVFFADETNSRIIVKGMPQEVADIKKYMEKLDVENLDVGGPRTTTRIIRTDGSSVTPDLIEDLFSTTGRENRLQIYMPKDLRPRGSFDEFRQPTEERDDSTLDEGASTPEEDNAQPPNGSGHWRSRHSWMLAASQWTSGASLANLVAVQEPQESDEPAPPPSAEQEAEADEPKSVPGADVQVKITEHGIVLTSDDLDALDELESVLRAEFDELSASARPGVFYLRYRDPKDAKIILEKLIGQGGSSSGGSDPLSSLLGAGVNNMIPGMGDLLGGGSSTTTSGEAVFEMEGPVVIMADTEMRALIVAASSRDMDTIAPLITDYIDQPGAPHDPKIQGEFYSIPVIYRDPAELKTTLEAMLPDLIRTESEQEQGRQNQSPEQQILRQLMQARGGQQQAEEELKEPKAVLGVDEQGHALLVSGPPFIYQQILLIVKKLDSPELSEKAYVIMPMEGRNADSIAKALKASLGDKLELTGQTPQTTPGGQNQAQPSPQANPMGNQQAQQQEAARNAMMQAMQQMNRGNRGQQQGNRGNRGQGGGNRRGGGGGNQGGAPFQFPGGG